MKTNRAFLKKAGIAALVLVVFFAGFLLGKAEGNSNQDVYVNQAAQPQQDVQVQQEASDNRKDYYEIVKKNPPVADLSVIPEYQGNTYCLLNDNIPFFSTEELDPVPYEYYSPLDDKGRCGTAFAIACKDTMPTGDRKDIRAVHPTGWQSTDYDFIEEGSLYNRSHLIARSLCAEEANERNLITGTQYMNQVGMDEFEVLTAGYIDDTRNHVAYRVTPVFEGDNAVASGVIMEGYSLEDKGEGVCFCVYVYNVQPGVRIDYATGDNEADEKGLEQFYRMIEDATYIINKRKRTFHTKDCIDIPAESNRVYSNESVEELIKKGYKPHKKCIQ